MYFHKIQLGQTGYLLNIRFKKASQLLLGSRVSAPPLTEKYQNNLHNRSWRSNEMKIIEKILQIMLVYLIQNRRATDKTKF